MSKGRYALLVAAIFLAGAFLRFYHFPDRLIFGPEQSMGFITSAENLKKLSLLGEKYIQRATSDSHAPFHGAYYSYLLLPFLLLFNFQVLPVTFLFILLNLLTALIIFLVTKKLFGRTLAILSLFFFLFSPVMIHHSLFAWILNPLPLVGILDLWLLFRLAKQNDNLWTVFFLGFLSGFGFGLQNLFLPFAILLFLFVIAFSNKKNLGSLTYFFGIIIGNLPMFIFDLRHDFYHMRTLWQFLLDVLSHRVAGYTDYYNFLYLFPFLFLFYAIITLVFYRIYKPLVYLPLLVYLYFGFTSPLVNLESSTGMPEGITLATLENASAVIAADKPPAKFNVATLWDFDTRAHTLRYLLTYYYHQTPQAVETYKDVDALYVFAPENYDLENPRVWELQTFLPYKIEDLPLNSPGYRLVKLTK